MEYSLQNNFFYLKHEFQINYFIYIYPHTPNKDYKFTISLLSDGLYIFINNKVINRPDNLKIKIMKNDKTSYINQNMNLDILCNKVDENNLPSIIIILQNINDSIIKIGDITKLHYVNIAYNNGYYERNNSIDDSIFDVYYYSSNNPFLKNIYLNDIDFIKMHWNYTGQYHPQLYFKQILYKYRNIILNLKYHKNNKVENNKIENN